MAPVLLQKIVSGKSSRAKTRREKRGVHLERRRRLIRNFKMCANGGWPVARKELSSVPLTVLMIFECTIFFTIWMHVMRLVLGTRAHAPVAPPADMMALPESTIFLIWLSVRSVN